MHSSQTFNMRFVCYMVLSGLHVFLAKLCPCETFFVGGERGGVVKDRMYMSPATITDLKARITATIASIDTGMLHTVWQELRYRLDVC